MYLVDCDLDGVEVGNFVREEMFRIKLGDLVRGGGKG